MPIAHHPEAAVLLAYASGAADEPSSLVVATHLALCPECRQVVAAAERAGGVLLEDIPAEPLAPQALDRVFGRLGEQEQRKAPRKAGLTPEPLRTYLGGEMADVKWRHIAGGISEYRIMKHGSSVARLLKATPGTAVSEHTHHGEELTLILTGGLADHTGQYHRGDVQSMGPDVFHEPTALPGEDCIVLAATDAPLRFKSLAMAAFAKVMRF